MDQMMSDHRKRNEEISRSVVEAVANAADVEPTALRPPLYDVIDPDALNELCENADGPLKVQFEYADFFVTVGGDGRVMVEDPASAQTSRQQVVEGDGD